MISSKIQLVISVIQKVTVEPIIFLFMFATLLGAPAVQLLIYKKVCLNHFNRTVCDNLNSSDYKAAENVVQDESSHWYLAIHLGYEIPAILASLVFGNVSDHLSRKLAIILPLVGQVFSFFNHLINAAAFQLPVGFLLLGPLISGCFGGWIGCCLAVFSFISEDSSRESRTFRIGAAEAITSLALALGSFFSGMLLDNTSFVFVFSLVLLLYISALVYAILMVKSPKNECSETSGSHKPSIGCVQKLRMTISPSSIRDSAAVVIHKRKMNRRTHIWVILSFVLMSGLALSPSVTLSFLFVKRQPLSWSQTTYGYYIGTSLAIESITLPILLPILKKKLHFHETTIMMMTLVTGALAEVLFAFSVTTWMVFLVPLVRQIIGPNFQATCARSLISSFVEPLEYGKMFAVYGSFQSISGILSSTVYNNLYPLTLNHWVGLCFVIGASFTIVPMTLLVWLNMNMKKIDKYCQLKEDLDSDIVTTPERQYPDRMDSKEGAVQDIDISSVQIADPDLPNQDIKEMQMITPRTPHEYL